MREQRDPLARYVAFLRSKRAEFLGMEEQYGPEMVSDLLRLVDTNIHQTFAQPLPNEVEKIKSQLDEDLRRLRIEKLRRAGKIPSIGQRRIPSCGENVSEHRWEVDSSTMSRQGSSFAVDRYEFVCTRCGRTAYEHPLLKERVMDS